MEKSNKVERVSDSAPPAGSIEDYYETAKTISKKWRGRNLQMVQEMGLDCAFARNSTLREASEKEKRN